MIRPALALLVLVSAPAAAAEKRVSVGSFDRVRVTGPFEVTHRTGSPGASVSGDARAVERVRVGSFARAMLLPAASVTLPVAPGKPAAAGTSSGVFAFEAPAAGRYRVALGAPAWLDVVRGGKALTSVTHGHGPACTGIRKTVDFDLKPGRHLLQIVGSPTPGIDLMVVRLR